MKKLFSLFIAPIFAGSIIVLALHTFIPYSNGYSYDMLNHSQTDFTFGLLGFLFGFLPCFIYGYALHALAGMKATTGSQAAPEHEITSLYVGQVICVSGSNCRVRVKAVKQINIFADLQADQFNYVLNFSL